MLCEKKQLPQLCAPSLPGTGSNAHTASRQGGGGRKCVWGSPESKFSVHLPQAMTPCSWGTDSEDERKSEQLLSVAAPTYSAGLK